MADPTTTSPEPAKSGEQYPTGFWVVNVLPDGTQIGFYDRYKSIDLYQIGYPISPAMVDPETRRVIQWFERARMEFHPEATDPKFKIMFGLVGAEAYKSSTLYANNLLLEISSLQQQLSSLQQTRVNESTALNLAIQQRDSQIHDLTNQLAIQTQQVTKLDKQSSDRYVEIQNLKAQVVTLQQQLANCHQPPPPPPPSDPTGSGSNGGGTTDNGPVKDTWGTPQSVAPVQLWRPAMAVNPVSGLVSVMGESGSGGNGVPAAQLLICHPGTGACININDATPNGAMYARACYDKDSNLYVTWRHQPAGYRAYMRVLPISGSAPQGWDLGTNWAGTGYELDQPDIAYSIKENKLYMTGQVQSNPPAWGIAESTDGGHTWVNYTVLAQWRPTQMNVQPRIAIDPNGNIHVMACWGDGIVARSRVGGQWLPLTSLITPAQANGYIFRFPGRVAMSSDDYAYAVFDTPQSIGLARLAPGDPNWRVLNLDVFNGANAKWSSVTAAGDGRVWVSGGFDLSAGPQPGVVVAESRDYGQHFAAPVTAISHSQDSELNEIRYDAVQNCLHLVATFKDPRESIYVKTI